MPTYLEQLTVALLDGTSRLPADVVQRHATWLLSKQNSDGGFSGRDGPSDLYYTGFALRSIAILGRLDSIAEAAAEFLRSRLAQRESIVDFYSLIYAARLLATLSGIDILAEAQPGWQDQIAAALEELRRDDGGFAKAAEGRASSTYHSFLALLCLELIERAPRDPEQLREFFFSQRMPEGGFREIRVSKRAGTNPTAAAIGGLRILNSLTDEVRRETADFLLDLQNDEGGFLANTRIPIADLLSTFTAMWTLRDVGGLAEVDLSAATRFVRSLESDEGGYLGAAWDEVRDVEYTFYGIGCQALLASAIAASN